MCGDFTLVSITGGNSHSRGLRVSQCLICVNDVRYTKHLQDGGKKSCLIMLKDKCNWHLGKDSHVPGKNHFEAKY